MIQYLQIGIHSIGKASIHFYNFLLDCAIFSNLAYKEILALFVFSAYAYYRVNLKNNAAIIVWVCW